MDGGVQPTERPIMEQMAAYLEGWDAVTDVPRGEVAYFEAAAMLLRIVNEDTTRYDCLRDELGGGDGE